MGDAFHMGGWGMVPTTIFGVLLILASVRYAISPERRLVPLQMSLGVVTLASGCLGFVTGLIKSTTALSSAGADKRWIWLVGFGESLNNVALALVLIVIGALAASAGALRLARGSKGSAPETA